ncbi:condensation domain-containing protein, partial [Paenibacillus xylanexedens]|uniref:condensation domain-containing protein n=1 Tax=Paenibacillus xylanexedens TaxID=528191 RepID=UPI0021B6BBB1
MSMSGFPTGFQVSPQSERPHALDIVGSVMDGKLMLSVTYDEQEYRDSTMQGLLDNYKEQLLSIIEHCMQQTEQELTPSDMGSVSIPLATFDALRKQLVSNDTGGLLSIYPLSPMQEG